MNVIDHVKFQQPLSVFGHEISCGQRLLGITKDNFKTFSEARISLEIRIKRFILLVI